MNFTLKLVETNKQIDQAILKAMLPSCISYMKKVAQNIQVKIPPIISDAIVSQPEYASLVSGSLRLEFGIPNANSKIAELINFWINNMKFSYQPPSIISSKIRSSISLEMIKSDFSDILGSDAAQVIDNARGYSLPWLEWLLLDGSKIIVPKYDVIIAPNSRSRTGMALMKSSKTNWKVPSEFAGTIRNNWITRSIENNNSIIINTIESCLL